MTSVRVQWGGAPFLIAYGATFMITAVLSFFIPRPAAAMIAMFQGGNAVPIATLTPERFVEDGHALTQYLLERFHRDKIYVYGTSWSSIPGVWLVQKYPQQYYAFIGNGQMVNTTENDIQGYELALDYLAKKSDTKMDVLVYIFAEREDVNAMSSIVERWFNRLDAPKKDLIWLEGGHGLGDENLGQFVDVMVNKVLLETYPAH